MIPLEPESYFSRGFGSRMFSLRAGSGCVPANHSPDTSVRRFEIGGQVTYAGLYGCEWAQKGCNQFGRGAGVGVNMNRHFAID